MKEEIGVAIFGAGAVAHTHAVALQQSGGAKITGVFSLGTFRGKSLAAKTFSKVYSTIDEALSDGNVDAVDICLPMDDRGQAFTKAVDSGKHVLCEPPLGSTLQEFDRMIDHAKKEGVRVMLAHWTSFSPQLASYARYLNEQMVVGEERIGRIYWLTSSCRWKKQYETTSENALGFLSHPVHFARSLVRSELKNVYALTQSCNKSGVIDFYDLGMAFEDTTIFLEAGWCMPKTYEPRIAVDFAGTKGTFIMDNRANASIQAYDSSRYLSVVPSMQQWSLASDEDAGYLREVKQFIEYVRNGKEPSVTMGEARKSMEVALAALESANRLEAIAVAR